MKHDRVPPTAQPLSQEWRTMIFRQLLPEEQDLLYLRYIEEWDTAGIAEALQSSVNTLEGPQGRLVEADRHLLEAYARCQRPGTALAPLTPAELVRQIFPPPPVPLPADFASRVLTQVGKLRQARERRDEAMMSPIAQVAACLGPGLSTIWESFAWHPPFAGEPVHASQTSAQTHRFYFPYGDIQATCEWRVASRHHPAMLRLTWRAHLTFSGEFWVQFVSRDDPIVDLGEAICLGRALTGTVELSDSTLGFDPTQVPWSLVLFLTAPQGKAPQGTQGNTGT